jgi:hypothetical protein
VNESPSRSPVEREIAKRFVDTGGAGKPLSRRARHTRRTVEAYLAAGVMPRYMERLREIDGQARQLARQLERSYRSLWRECEGDRELFASRWAKRAHAWPFDRLNALIREHNEWYPIETRLPLDPRTGDYVRVRGRSYRRAALGPEWVLARFPPSGPEQPA